MGKYKFQQTKDKIATFQKEKNNKIKEMEEMYENLTKNQELLDIVMLQMAKDVEERFPGVEFEIISRIKSKSSFQNKLQNDLSAVSNMKELRELQIYDIIALTLIVSHVPYGTVSSANKNDECYDADFDGYVTNLLKSRKSAEDRILQLQKSLESKNERIKEKNKIMQEKNSLIESTNSKLEKCDKDDKQLKTELTNNIEEYKKDIKNIEVDIKYIKNDIKEVQEGIAGQRAGYAQLDNMCNHRLAEFIERNLCKYPNVKAIGLTEIPDRFKPINKYNGYVAAHDCFKMKTIGKDKNGKSKEISFICELQAKSMEGYRKASRGSAANYHIAPEAEEGKVAKDCGVPEIKTKFESEEEKQEYKESIKIKVPRFRMLRRNKGKNEIYKLSLKESFLLYYSNQLFGNPTFNIKPDKKKQRQVLESEGIPADDYKIYGEDMEYHKLDEER